MSRSSHINTTGLGGKGSKRRKEDKKKFDDNYDRIFGNKNKSEPPKESEQLDLPNLS